MNTYLRCDAKQAEALLQSQIETLSALVEDGRIDGRKGLGKSRADFLSWERYTESLLKQKIFSDDQVANEVFCKAELEVFVGPNSFEEDRQIFVDKVDSYRGKLKSVIDRLELYSPTTNVVPEKTSTVSEYSEPPDSVKTLMWLSDWETWKAHPFLSCLAVVILSVTSIATLYALLGFFWGHQDERPPVVPTPEPTVQQVGQPAAPQSEKPNAADAAPEINVGSVEALGEYPFRKLRVGVVNSGGKIDVVNGLEIEFKKRWVLNGLREKGVTHGFGSTFRPDINVSTKKDVPFTKELANVGAGIEAGSFKKIDFSLGFSPTPMNQVMVYSVRITLHCGHHPDVTVDNVLLFSPARKGILFGPRGGSLVKEEVADKLFDSVVNEEKATLNVALQVANRKSVKEMNALPTTEKYQLPVQLKTVFDEVLGSRPAVEFQKSGTITIRP